MTTALKCTTVVLLSVLMFARAVSIGSFTPVDYGISSYKAATSSQNAAATDEVHLMNVSDVPYVPSAEDRAMLSKAMKKVGDEPEPVVKTEEMAAEPEEIATEAEEEAFEPEATMEVAPEEMVVEAEGDWQSGQEAYGYDEGASTDGDDASSYDGGEYVNANVDGAHISGSDLQFNGVYCDEGSGYSYTYYSENVLPGGGLDIPGRHVGDEGYVCDADGNICIASDDLPKGTVVSVPFGSGTAVVYDSGSGYGNLDVYTAW